MRAISKARISSAFIALSRDSIGERCARRGEAFGRRRADALGRGVGRSELGVGAARARSAPAVARSYSASEISGASLLVVERVVTAQHLAERGDALPRGAQGPSRRQRRRLLLRTLLRAGLLRRCTSACSFEPAKHVEVRPPCPLRARACPGGRCPGQPICPLARNLPDASARRVRAFSNRMRNPIKRRFDAAPMSQSSDTHAASGRRVPDGRYHANRRSMDSIQSRR